MTRSFCVALLGLVTINATVARAAEANWPQFRGPSARGTAENAELPDTWSATENVRWQQTVPGRGWSSPIVWNERVFVTSVTYDGEKTGRESKRGLYLGGNRDEAPKVPHQWRVYCLNLEDGHILWEQLAHEGLPPESSHLKNTYASETPVTDGERVYVYFGNLGLYCYSMDGKLIWSHPVTAHKTAAGWGTGSSPTLDGERIYVLNDNEDQSYLVALDKRTGTEVWRTERSERSCWSTPFVWKSGQRTEIVVSGSGAVRSYDLDGKILWELGDMSGNAIPTPMAGPELLYVSSGYFMGNKKPVMAIRPGATGDITLQPSESNNAFVAWCQRTAAPYNPSILLYRDQVYIVSDLGIFASYDAATGAPAYDKKRLPQGRAFTASPWAYNGKVFCQNEFGDTFVIKAGREFELLHVNSMGDQDMWLATPAIAGNKLLLRSDHRVIAIENAAGNSPAAAR